MKKYVVAVYDMNDDVLTQQITEGVTEYDAILTVLEEKDEVQAQYLAEATTGCLGTLKEITHDYMSLSVLEI